MSKTRVLMYNLFNSYKLIERISYGYTDCPRQGCYNKWVLKVMWWTRNGTSSTLRKLFKILCFFNPFIIFYCCDKMHDQNYLGGKKTCFDSYIQTSHW